jgi:formylglycine-generating enzyme required for sulfatase activity
MIAAAGIDLRQPAAQQAGDACVRVTHGLLTKAGVARFIAGGMGPRGPGCQDPAMPPENTAARDRAQDSMIRIPGGAFLMGSEEFYPEELPVRTVHVDEFWIDPRPVTVGEFSRFVQATGYVTVAERPLDPAEYPDADPDLLVPGSAVFCATAGPVPLDSLVWWRYIPGACWRAPEGPGSKVSGREEHPVTQIAYEDAEAYARWAGKALPTEAEWERAARGGLEGARFAWGDEQNPDGRWMANTWQGEFPWQNLALDGYPGTSPVGSFPPNGYGLYDVTGNVWEWTCEAGSPPPPATRIIKGGSHLCAPSYCLRYRPSARQIQTVDTSTSHIGMRCVIRGLRGG